MRNMRIILAMMIAKLACGAGIIDVTALNDYVVDKLTKLKSLNLISDGYAAGYLHQPYTIFCIHM